LEAASYDQALALAATSEFQLLLTDSVMPHVSGATLAERITRLRPGLSVLYMSGYGPVALGASPGADQAAGMHVQKPFTAPALLQAVSQALNTA
jgi:DNA-binding NtrC family response regulator